MRVVLQRVSSAAVTIGAARSAAIGAGLLILVGFSERDDSSVLEWMADKIIGLRVFDDSDGRMNLSLVDVAGALLVVSQFTLYGDTRKGRRPSFVDAASPELAEPLYRSFVELMSARAPGPVAEGQFGAKMAVALVNDGPVTLVIDRDSESGR